MDQTAIREVLRSPLDDLRPRRKLGVRDLRRAALGLVSVAALVLVAQLTAPPITGPIERALEPAASIRADLPILDLQAMAADPETGRLIVFGGRLLEGGGFAGGVSEQTWQFSDGAWWWLRSDGPDPRLGHGMAFDESARQVIMFGGSPVPYAPCFAVQWCGAEPLADTWAFDPSAGRWEQQSPSRRPPARFGHSIAYDAGTGTVVMFGGANVIDGRTSTFGDTWVYDADAAAWTEITTATTPPPRAHHQLVSDPAGGVILFGGVGPGLEAADLWRFDGTDWKLLVGDLGIGNRSMTAAVLSDGTLTVVGGTGGSTTVDTSRFLNDVLTIDVATGDVQTTGASEEALWRHTAAAEAGTDGIVVIALGKTLRYEPSTGEWTDLTPTSDL